MPPSWIAYNEALFIVRYPAYGVTEEYSSCISVMYHFVWIAKYRHKVSCEPCGEVLKRIFEKIGYDYNIDIVELEIPVDHLHMVVRSEPKQSPSDVMQIIKNIFAREFLRRYPEIKKRYFWGGKLWRQSYFVETIGNANEEMIGAYV